MRLEGDTEVHIQNVLAMMEGHKAVIDGYLSGEWTLEAQPQPPPAVAAASMAGPRQENELDVEQNVVLNAIKDMVMWALERRYPEDVTAEELEQFMKKPPAGTSADAASLCPRPSWKWKKHGCSSGHPPSGCGRSSHRHCLPNRSTCKHLPGAISRPGC